MGEQSAAGATLDTYVYGYGRGLDEPISMQRDIKGSGGAFQPDATQDEVTRFLYSGHRVIEERDDSAAVLASYVYGRGLDEVVSMQRDVVNGAGAFVPDDVAENYFYLADTQNNTLILTDAEGQMVEAYAYGTELRPYVHLEGGAALQYPNDFGMPAILDETGAVLHADFTKTGMPTHIDAPDDVTAGSPYASRYGNPYLFNGRRWDSELGLYYYRNRHLDPIQGRFTTLDPIGRWGDPMNLGNGYSYVGTNPWTYVDPFGLQGGLFSSLAGGANWYGEAVRDYALYSYGQAALGVGDWVVGGVKSLPHLADRAVNPIQYAISDAQTAYYVATNFREVQDAVGEELYAYLIDFDSRDAGALLPDLVGLGLGIAEARAARGTLALRECVPDPPKPPTIKKPDTYANWGDEFLDDGTRMVGQPHVRPNPVEGKPRVGSANQVDETHAFSDLVDNFAVDASRFEIPTRGPGGVLIESDARLYQIEGGLGNLRAGIFEWIVEGEKVTHRRYIPGGRITGYPNQVINK